MKRRTRRRIPRASRTYSGQKITMPALTERDIITYTGVRAPTFEERGPSSSAAGTSHNLIHVAGIQSLGLTTAPRRRGGRGGHGRASCARAPRGHQLDS